MSLSKILFGLLMLASIIGHSQIETTPTALNHQSIQFIQNDGQWHNNVQYRAPLGAGSVFLENNAFTYVQLNPEQLSHDHGNADTEALVDGHAWRSTLLGANANPQITGLDKSSTYHNYFIGQDASKWAAHVPIFNTIKYNGIYTGIDLAVYSSNAHFKYDFLVEPFANPSQIKMQYEGLKDLEIRNGNLILNTSIGEFIENAPYAYQIIAGKKITVKCQFQIEGNAVSFSFPEGYDASKGLVIDPELVGATLSGSTVFNYGHGATYDAAGNIYTSAASTGPGYLTTVGAFQTSYAGGEFDVAISKYSPTASALIYATYIGGSNSDYPNSMITNSSEELFIYGSTKSLDFPVSADAYQDISADDGFEHDIFVLHLAADGGSLIGSTYMGGTGDDGQNPIAGEWGTERRGEILLDEFDNCYVATTTESADFPSTLGAYQETFGGGDMDVTIFSLTADMSDLNWSTFMGSTTDEVGLGMHFDPAGNLLINGATTGEFITMSGYQTSYQGGISDGFIVQLLADGSAIGNGTYWGTTEKDAVYLIEQDLDGNIYLYGTSEGASIVTPGVYSNPDGLLFIAQLSADLSTLNFATNVGNEGDDLTPSGFMADSCGYIYFACYDLFNNEGFYYSPDAITEEGGIYVGVLEPLAVDMQYGTAYSGNHLDGGICHFDAVNKVVYHSVCACDTFITTPDAHDPEIESWGICDIGVFKIDFSGSFVTSSVEVLPGLEGEGPFTVYFDSNAAVDDSVFWDFGDGTEGSNDEGPTHTFDEVGVYDVWFYAYGICSIDSVLITITVTIDDSGIDELGSEVAIYPNPATDQFTINGISTGTIINLLNAQGQLVYSAIASSKKVDIDTRNLANGLYFIHFEGDISKKMHKILVLR